MGWREQNRLFTFGIIIGAAGGLIIGSIIAAQYGDKVVGSSRSLLARILRQRPQVRFEFLLQ
ncbi:MAG: hypothetical protein EPO21_08895 [Chloroflexota bacterium]|nr:MAG: hypothetical protein EPO21_08895 [Chloroflexota bacterium]